MNPNIKDIFDTWLEQQLSGNKPASADNGGKVSFADIKEILLMKLLAKAVGDDDGSGSNVAEQMRAENEKQRQFYENKLKEQDEKIKDLVLEKRFQGMEKKQSETIQTLSGELQAIHEKIEGLRDIPPTATPAEKADAVTQIENLGGEFDRIRKALGKFGVNVNMPGSGSAGAAIGIPEAYKNADGSVNWLMYGIDKIDGCIRTYVEGTKKEAPPFEKVQKIPEKIESEDEHYLRVLQQVTLSAEDIAFIKRYEDSSYRILKEKPQKSPMENEFVKQYEARMGIKAPESVKPEVRVPAEVIPEPEPKPDVKAQTHAVPESIKPREELSILPCKKCGGPGVIQGGLCSKCLGNGSGADVQISSEIPAARDDIEEGAT